MKFDLAKLTHVCAVARLKSFSRAAEELNITQPALSRSIAATEDQLGVRLFDRSRRGVTLTPAGKSAVEQAEALLAEARRFERHCRLIGSGESGRIAFGLGPMVASLILPTLVRNMVAERPHLHLKAEVKAPEALGQELNAGRLEIFFCARAQAPRTPNHEVETVGLLQISMIARAGHPLSKRRDVKMADLADWPIACAVEWPAAPRDGAAIICDNYHILREIVLEGDAVWITSPQMVADDLTAGRLVRLEVTDWPVGTSEIVAVRLKRRSQSQIAAQLVEEVRGLIAAASPA